MVSAFMEALYFKSGTLIKVKAALIPLCYSLTLYPLNFIFSFLFFILPPLALIALPPLCPTFSPFQTDTVHDFDLAFAPFTVFYLNQRLSETCLFLSDTLYSPKKIICSGWRLTVATNSPQELVGTRTCQGHLSVGNCVLIYCKCLNLPAEWWHLHTYTTHY